MTTKAHVSVLLDESIQALSIKPDGCYIDATFGRGGHSRAILAQLGPNGQLLSIDRDPQACAVADQIDDPRFHFYRGPFSSIKQFVEQQGWMEQVDGILFDLGVSSPQLDQAERGFSFLHDGPLDMRMDPENGQSAAEWLAQADADDIAWVLKTFGEERHAKRIARAIVQDRVEKQPYTRTKALADMIARVNPSKERNKHPATRSFQAIRIYINSELKEIETALDASLSVLAEQGRLAVISFHSLEDRIVKQFIKRQSKGAPVPKGLPLTEAELKQDCTLDAVGKAIKPSDAEIAVNPRSRSSVLRIAKRRAR